MFHISVIGKYAQRIVNVEIGDKRMYRENVSYEEIQMYSVKILKSIWDMKKPKKINMKKENLEKIYEPRKVWAIVNHISTLH